MAKKPAGIETVMASFTLVLTSFGVAAVNRKAERKSNAWILILRGTREITNGGHGLTFSGTSKISQSPQKALKFARLNSRKIEQNASDSHLW
jgi:hypothetical protein